MYKIKQIDDFTIGIQKPSSPSTYANMDKSIYAPHFNEIYCTLKIIRARTRTLTENRIPWSCNPTEIYLKNRIKVIENSWNITQEDSYIERHISTVTIQKYNKMHACVCSFFGKIYHFQNAQSGFELNYCWNVVWPTCVCESCFSVVIHCKFMWFLHWFATACSYLILMCHWILSHCSIALTLLLDRESNINIDRESQSNDMAAQSAPFGYKQSHSVPYMQITYEYFDHKSKWSNSNRIKNVKFKWELHVCSCREPF